MNKTTEALKLAHSFCAELVTFGGKYPYINGTEVVRDAYTISAAIREALVWTEITTPDVCGEVSARAKLCYGCGKALDEANEKLNNDHAWLSKEELTQYWKGYGDGKREALADHSGDANEMVYSKPSVFDGVCCGCSKKAADGWALYCVECWEKSNGDPVAASGKLITEQDHIANAGKPIEPDHIVNAGKKAEKDPVSVLKASKANFERQFGKQIFADWVYYDLEYSFENAAPPKVEQEPVGDWEQFARRLQAWLAQAEYENATLRQQISEAEQAEQEPVAIPLENSQEADNAIEAMLAEYSYPSNPKNAARAGWRAARLYTAPPKAEQEPVAWHEPNAYGNVTTHKKWAEENGWLPLYTKE